MLFGGGGLLTADKGLTFDFSSGTLTVSRLRVSEVPYSILLHFVYLLAVRVSSRRRGSF